MRTSVALLFSSAILAFAAERPASAPVRAVAREPIPASGWLAAAQQKMKTGVWEVKGTIHASRTVRVDGFLAGADFDLTFVGVDGGEATHQIAIGDKSWLSLDSGKTWASTPPYDRQIFHLTRFPMVSSFEDMGFESVGFEKHQGETLLHIRLKRSGYSPDCWLSLDAQGKPASIRRYHGAVVSSGGRVADCKLEFRPAKDKKISKPAIDRPR